MIQCRHSQLKCYLTQRTEIKIGHEGCEIKRQEHYIKSSAPQLSREFIEAYFSSLKSVCRIYLEYEDLWCKNANIKNFVLEILHKNKCHFNMRSTMINAILDLGPSMYSYYLYDSFQ